MSFGESFDAKDSPTKKNPKEKNSDPATSVLLNADLALAELKNGLVSERLRIPDKATVKHMDFDTDGDVSGEKVLINKDKVKLNIDFVQDTPGIKGYGTQAHRRSSEVSLQGVSDTIYMQEQRVLMHGFGNRTASDRFEGKIVLELPMVITNRGDISKYESDFEITDPAEQKKILAAESARIGGFKNFPNGELIEVLATRFDPTDANEVVIRVEPDGKPKGDVFAGKQTITITFKHNANSLDAALKREGNTAHAREEHVDDKVKAKEKGKDEKCESCPADRPATKESKEKTWKLGDSTVDFHFCSITRDAGGNMHFASREKLLEGTTIDATFTESTTRPGMYSVSLKITSGSTTYEYLSKLSSVPVSTGKMLDEYHLDFVKVP